VNPAKNPVKEGLDNHEDNRRAEGASADRKPLEIRAGALEGNRRQLGRLLQRQRDTPARRPEPQQVDKVRGGANGRGPSRKPLDFRHPLHGQRRPNRLVRLYATDGVQGKRRRRPGPPQNWQKPKNGANKELKNACRRLGPQLLDLRRLVRGQVHLQARHL